MNARSARRNPSISALGKALMGVALLGPFPPSSAPASPIRHRRPPLRVRQARDADGFAAFLDGGPAHWARSRAPRIPEGIALRAIDGPSADTSLQGYLHWRRGLNAARFDRNHPRIGPMLAQQAISLPAIVPLPIPPPTLPEVSADAIQPPTLTPIGPPRSSQEQTVPEPSTLAMALALIGGGVCWRRALRGSCRP